MVNFIRFLLFLTSFRVGKFNDNFVYLVAYSINVIADKMSTILTFY